MADLRNPDKPEGLAIGTNICIKNSTIRTFYKILNRDTLFYRDLHASLAAAATEAFAEVTNLNPTTGQLLQITNIEIDGNVEVSLKQPAATNRWGTQRSPTGGLLTDRHAFVGSQRQLNLWVLENFPPNVQLVNNADVAIIATLWWIGWRYEIQFIGETADGLVTRGRKPVEPFVEVSVGPPGQ